MGLVTNSIAGLVTNLRADRTDPPSDFNLRSDGFVRLTGRELVDRVRSNLSRGELTPLGESSGAIELEVLAAVEVTFLIEVIVY